MVRSHEHPVVKGNHENMFHRRPSRGFQSHAAEAVIWTRNQLTADDRQWLRDLKYSAWSPIYTIVHATLDAPQRWGYVFDKLAAAPVSISRTRRSVSSVIRSPVAFMRDTACAADVFQIQSDPAKKIFRQTSALGQPRDQIPGGLRRL